MLACPCSERGRVSPPEVVPPEGFGKGNVVGNYRCSIHKDLVSVVTWG